MPSLTELLEHARTAIERAQGEASAGGASTRALERRIAELETDVASLASRLVAAEQQTDKLMNLYVATYQLHATLRPAEVLAIVSEIAVNLVGAERFVLILRGEDGKSPEIVLAHGLTPDLAAFGGSHYTGGDALVDATLGDGTLRLGKPGETAAAVPLTVHGQTVGVLVFLRLFAHRAPLGPDDREILDLLAAHAASALTAARLHAAADRKLRTLEGLMRLVREK